jgi:heptosyltransferase-2
VKNQNPLRILIIAPAWVGDMVMAQSLFISLKQQHPRCQIDVVAPAWTLGLLKKMPEVSLAIKMPLERRKLGLLTRITLGKSLQAHHYDQAILLPNTWKSALTPFFAKIPHRTGYLGESRWGLLNDIRRLDPSVLPQTVQRFVALADNAQPTIAPSYPFPQLKVSKESQQDVITQYAVTTGPKILALCPGAEYGESKRWPAIYYAKVARDKINAGWQVWLLGSGKDSPIAAEINQLCTESCIDFCGKTSIEEAVDLLSLADVVISNDSGLMHVAAALDKNLIAIYGSSDPEFTPPLSAKAKILRLGLDCSPCFERTCPLEHTHCLTELKPQQVLDALDSLSEE